MKQLHILTLLSLPLLNACVSMARPSAYTPSRAHSLAHYTASAPRSLFSGFSLAAVFGASVDRGRLGEDQTIGMAGVLGNTVNEVVPIPGTDMIKVGMVQEGTFFQSSFRSPNQEAMTRGGGVVPNAVLIFRIFRP